MNPTDPTLMALQADREVGRLVNEAEHGEHEKVEGSPV